MIMSDMDINTTYKQFMNPKIVSAKVVQCGTLAQVSPECSIIKFSSFELLLISALQAICLIKAIPPKTTRRLGTQMY